MKRKFYKIKDAYNYEPFDLSAVFLVTDEVSVVPITVEKISGTKTLSNADNGKVFILTANCLVTWPNTLLSFSCSFKTLNGANYSQALGVGVTQIGNIGVTMGENASFSSLMTGSVANEHVISGAL